MIYFYIFFAKIKSLWSLRACMNHEFLRWLSLRQNHFPLDGVNDAIVSALTQHFIKFVPRMLTIYCCKRYYWKVVAISPYAEHRPKLVPSLAEHMQKIVIIGLSIYIIFHVKINGYTCSRRSLISSWIRSEMAGRGLNMAGWTWAGARRCLAID